MAKLNRNLRVILTADDLGISPLISQTIIDLGEQGLITHASLMVNSPWVAHSLDLWRKMARPLTLGLHVALTIDRPIASPASVAPLLHPTSGEFWRMPQQIRRLALGQVPLAALCCEVVAQIKRFVELTGHLPEFINSHQHLHALPQVREAIRRACREYRYEPWVRGFWGSSTAISPRAWGERGKWEALAFLHGRWEKQHGRARSVLTLPYLPGSERALGLGLRRAQLAKAEAVELIFHPGGSDPELFERDVPANNPWHARRAIETQALSSRKISAVLDDVLYGLREERKVVGPPGLEPGTLEL